MNEEGKGLPLPMSSAEQIAKCSQNQARQNFTLFFKFCILL
jgi:hypothetical protein